MILITGGMGFIGLHAAMSLLGLGEDVVITRFREYRLPSFLLPFLNKRLFVEKADVRNAEDLLRAGRKYAVTGIMHLASPPLRGPVAEGLRSNAEGLLQVLEAGSKLEVDRIVLASSIAIYAGVDADVWREDAPLPIDSPYPMTAYKKMFEIIGCYYSAQTQLSVVSARISAYGPLARGLYFFPAQAAHAAVKGVPVSTLIKGGNPPHAEDGIDFAYVTDTAEVLARLQTAASLRHSVYNIGSGRRVTNREIADAVRLASPDAVIDLQPGQSDHPLYPPLHIGRLKEELGWSPRYSVERGIAEYIDWLKMGNPF
ncbi:NAD-dependent epimerase/dehydratase family protein [Paenibacillus hamazuiensis]|uniref:NAD-dependent epimerase/dehydratase family protein n=1 Tax=Paenibacillus hamazuiensis TaxID=2936508 RepID=UPI00200E0B42|nr:NAD-dependent epimerase/dehydratase family protein [Paenibacillus hamazuiensis]